jgi:mono/diheme cytochrome c family protein
MRTHLSSLLALSSLLGAAALGAACDATHDRGGHAGSQKQTGGMAFHGGETYANAEAKSDTNAAAHDADAARDVDLARDAEAPGDANMALDSGAVADASLASDASASADTGLVLDPQREGDPERGRQLLLDNGTPEVPYLSCGVPEAVVRLAGLDSSWGSALKISDRRDKDLPYESNYVVRPSGVRVVATNCLLCHAAKLGGQVVIGMPEVNRDFTEENPFTGDSGALLRLAASFLLDEPTQVELARILRVAEASAAFPRPNTIGINPADSMFGMLAMHRDPTTLVWQDTPDPAAGPVPSRILFSDVPALWNTHRRPHLFSTGFAHGDHARVMMTASLLCVDDRSEAEKIDAYFPDIRAYIESLRAPKYEAVSGRSIDSELAGRGQAHFANLCRRCHGDKDGEGGLEPRLFVPLAEVGTDPIYAEVTADKNDLPEAQTIHYFFEFFNRSWYGTYGAAGKLVRPSSPGYVPPPLDGVWATAPYFHNGSVPTLDGVLDPARRPRIFKRSFDPDAYDFTRAGYPYEEVAAKRGDPAVYDTNELGNSNQGHPFAAALTDIQRSELLEYLKTF